MSAVYAKIVQGRLGDDLRDARARASRARLELAGAAHARRPSARRMAFLARALRAQRRPTAPPSGGSGSRGSARTSSSSTAPTRRRCARARASTTTVPFPGAPGTTAIAGHRTTYLAPFRHIDQLRRGDEIVRRDALRRASPTTVERTRIVAPTELSRHQPRRLRPARAVGLPPALQRRASGSSCSPRLVDAQARGGGAARVSRCRDTCGRERALARSSATDARAR